MRIGRACAVRLGKATISEEWRPFERQELQPASRGFGRQNPRSGILSRADPCHADGAVFRTKILHADGFDSVSI